MSPGEGELLGPAPRLTNGRRPVPEANDAHDDVTPAKRFPLAGETQPVGDWSRLGNANGIRDMLAPTPRGLSSTAAGESL